MDETDTTGCEIQDIVKVGKSSPRCKDNMISPLIGAHFDQRACLAKVVGNVVRSVQQDYASVQTADLISWFRKTLLRNLFSPELSKQNSDRIDSQ